MWRSGHGCHPTLGPLEIWWNAPLSSHLSWASDAQLRSSDAGRGSVHTHPQPRLSILLLLEIGGKPWGCALRHQGLLPSRNTHPPSLSRWLLEDEIMPRNISLFLGMISWWKGKWFLVKFPYYQLPRLPTNPQSCYSTFELPTPTPSSPTQRQSIETSVVQTTQAKWLCYA